MTRPRRWLLAAAAVAAAAAIAVANAPQGAQRREHPFGVTPPDVTAADIARPSRPRGEQLYSVFCAVCHGIGGRGDGRAAAFCAIPPADFTRAEFKVRSTPTGFLPTDGDLQEVIRRGAGGDGAMPGFPFLREADLRLLITEVKRFAPQWARERAAAPLRLPLRVEGSARRGAAIYRSWGCGTCHGASGRGDGPLAATLRHSRGHADLPTDLTRPWTFKAGADDAGLARSILTGFTGTSMPAYALPVGRDRELWDLVAHLRSLQRPRATRPAAADTTAASAYWKPPVSVRGDSVSAASCASCHPLQFEDWSRSRHAAALGPGVWAQMHERPELTASCVRCHAPIDLQASDTRLPPDQTATLEYSGPIPPGARAIVGRVFVLPDAWHVESLQNHLRAARSPQAARLYAAALDEVERSGYTLLRMERIIR